MCGRQPRRETLVVIDRNVLLLVAVDADVADPGVRHEPQESLDHSQPGAQYGHDRDLVAQAQPFVDSSGVSISTSLTGRPRPTSTAMMAAASYIAWRKSPWRGLPVAHDRKAIGQHGVVDDFQSSRARRDATRRPWRKSTSSSRRLIATPNDRVACLDLGAADAGVLTQRDTYFTARRGRLKLRSRRDPRGELIAYRREDDPEPIESGYVVAAVAAPDELVEALDAALGTVVVVSKRRQLFLWEGVRIHLDEVDGLGSFMEFEAVLPDAGDLDTAHAKVDRLRTELGIRTMRSFRSDTRTY